MVIKGKFFLQITLFIAFTGAILPLANLAMAAQESSFFGDSIIENPGLLPTNPFYFLKRFRRLTQRAITVTSVKKAELELDILNQKAAEIKRLMEIVKSDREVLKDIADLYEESLGRLQSYLENIDAKSADALLNKLLETGFKHFLIFNSLETRQEILTIERLEALQGHLAGLITSALIRLDSQAILENRLDRVLEKQEDSLNQFIFNAIALNRLQEKSGIGSWLKIVLLQKQAKTLLEIQTILESASAKSLPEFFEDLPGNRLRYIKIIDELREQTLGSEIKNQLAIIRQRLFDILKDGRLLGKSDAESVRREAAVLTEWLESRLEEASFRSNVLNQLLLRAKFNLEQANLSFESGQYAEAVGQSSVSLAAAKRALVQIFYPADKLLKKMKNEYDALNNAVKDNDLTLELLGAAEKLIVKIADIASAKTVNFDKLNSALEEAQLTLLRAEREFQDALRQIEEAAAHKKSSKPFIERVLDR